MDVESLLHLCKQNLMVFFWKTSDNPGLNQNKLQVKWVFLIQYLKDVEMSQTSITHMKEKPSEKTSKIFSVTFREGKGVPVKFQ